MKDCIFCKIINGQIPANVVYEDEKIIAFDNIKPDAPVHVLIVPKIHIATVNDLTVDNVGLMADVHLAAIIIAKKLGIADKGYRLINNCGADAGQTLFHIHYHLIGGVSLGAKLI